MRIDGTCELIKAKVGTLSYELMRHGGYLDRLNSVNGYHPETQPVLDLLSAERELRNLADIIERKRKAMT